MLSHFSRSSALVLRRRNSSFFTSKNERIALLIDGDNAEASLIKEVITEAGRFGKITIKRVYADWTSPQMKSWKDQINTFAVKPIQKFAYTKSKNSTDTALIIDAMDMLHSKLVDGFCIVSSDSDYTGLAHRIREEGMFIMGIGRSHTPEAFVRACSQFTYSEILYPTITEDEKTIIPSESFGGSSVKSRIDEIDYDHIHSAFRNAVSVDTGCAGLSSLVTELRKLNPTFDHRNYGYTSFSKFWQSLQLPQYVTFIAKDGTTVLVREKDMAMPSTSNKSSLAANNSSKVSASDSVLEPMDTAVIDAAVKKCLIPSTGTANLGRINNELRLMYPSFDHRNYGFTSFLKFWQSLDLPQYSLSNEGNLIHVRNKSAHASALQEDSSVSTETATEHPLDLKLIDSVYKQIVSSTGSKLVGFSRLRQDLRTRCPTSFDSTIPGSYTFSRFWESLNLTKYLMVFRGTALFIKERPVDLPVAISPFDKDGQLCVKDLVDGRPSNNITLEVIQATINAFDGGNHLNLDKLFSKLRQINSTLYPCNYGLASTAELWEAMNLSSHYELQMLHGSLNVVPVYSGYDDIKATAVDEEARKELTLRLPELNNIFDTTFQRLLDTSSSNFVPIGQLMWEVNNIDPAFDTARSMNLLWEALGISKYFLVYCNHVTNIVRRPEGVSPPSIQSLTEGGELLVRHLLHDEPQSSITKAALDSIYNEDGGMYAAVTLRHLMHRLRKVCSTFYPQNYGLSSQLELWDALGVDSCYEKNTNSEGVLCITRVGAVDVQSPVEDLRRIDLTQIHHTYNMHAVGTGEQGVQISVMAEELKKFDATMYNQRTYGYTYFRPFWESLKITTYLLVEREGVVYVLKRPDGVEPVIVPLSESSELLVKPLLHDEPAAYITLDTIHQAYNTGALTLRSMGQKLRIINPAFFPSNYGFTNDRELWDYLGLSKYYTLSRTGVDTVVITRVDIPSKAADDSPSIEAEVLAATDLIPDLVQEDASDSVSSTEVAATATVTKKQVNKAVLRLIPLRERALAARNDLNTLVTELCDNVVPPTAAVADVNSAKETIDDVEGALRDAPVKLSVRWNSASRKKLLDIENATIHAVQLENEFRGKLTNSARKYFGLDISSYELLEERKELVAVFQTIADAFPPECTNCSLNVIRRKVSLEKCRLKSLLTVEDAGEESVVGSQQRGRDEGTAKSDIANENVSEALSPVVTVPDEVAVGCTPVQILSEKLAEKLEVHNFI